MMILGAIIDNATGKALPIPDDGDFGTATTVLTMTTLAKSKDPCKNIITGKMYRGVFDKRAMEILVPNKYYDEVYQYYGYIKNYKERNGLACLSKAQFVSYFEGVAVKQHLSMCQETCD